MLRCKDNSLYTGITNDLEKRFHQHEAQAGKGAKYLRGRGPLLVVFSCSMPNKSAALKAEAAVKRFSKARKEALVRGEVSLEDSKLSR